MGGDVETKNRYAIHYFFPSLFWLIVPSFAMFSIVHDLCTDLRTTYIYIYICKLVSGVSLMDNFWLFFLLGI